MPLQNDPDVSYAFISYHHSDNDIATAIRTELFRLAERGRGKRYLSCFLDTDPKSIEDGNRWEPIIKDHVELTDWLVCIYTGDQSDYCGFEVGAFSLRNELGSNTPVHDKHLICLYDVPPDKLPKLFSPYKNEQIIRSAITHSEVNTWWNSPVGRFLNQFCAYRQLYVPTHRENPAEYTIDIAQSAEVITRAFDASRKNDVKEETPCQLNFQLKVDPTDDGQLTCISDTDLVISTSFTFDILGLNLALAADRAPRITWGELRNKLLRSAN